MKFVADLAGTELQADVSDLDALSNATMLDSTNTVEQARQQLIAKVGENIKIRRLQVMRTTGTIGSYVHGGRIGVLVNLQGGDEELAKSIAMHVAASNPLVVTRDDVSAELVAKEKEIYSAQAQESGKPAEIIEKMVAGRINKFLDEVSLLGQPFVKDPSLKIAQLLKNANSEVLEFARFQVGEGIEKQETDFVAEVMAQVEESK